MARIRSVEEIHRVDHAGELLSGNRELAAASVPGGEEDGVEPLLLEGGERRDAVVRLDPDPQSGDVLQVPSEDVLRESIGWDSPAHDPAGFAVALEHGNVVARAGQEERGREAGRAGADDRDLLSAPFRGRAVLRVGVLAVVSVRHEPLDPTDRDRSLEGRSRALLLARSVARPAEDPHEGGVLEVLAECRVVLPGADERNVAVRFHPGGAGERAGGGAAARDYGLLGH